MATSANGVLAASSPGQHRPLLAIGMGGLIVGALDLTYAIIVYSVHQPILVPQTIASGVLGAKAYQGGMASAALGIALHFFIATIWASLYYVASRKLKFLVYHAVLCGMAYGVVVYLLMHFVVVPLSAVPPGGSTPFLYEAAEFVWHWFGVGLPIALCVRRYAP
jgi:uncharacterized membrane protein YagU involved in acid resistance